MKKLILIPAILISSSFQGVFAQDEETDKTRSCIICLGGEHNNPPPYELNFRREWPFLLTGASLAGLGVWAEFQNKLKPFTPQELDLLDKNDINSFDRGATGNWSLGAHRSSNVLISTATLLPALFVINHHTRNDMLSLILIAGEILAINLGIAKFTKNIVNRARPLTYNPDVPIEIRTGNTSRESYFSGHTSQTTAASVFMAKVMTDYHPNMKPGIKIGLWITMLSLPAVTAYLRVKAGRHFPSDVITGYSVGAAVGYLVPHLHKHKKEDKESKLSVLPVINNQYAGLYFNFAF